MLSSSLLSKLYKTKYVQKRGFWEYVNMMFNKPDYDHIKKVGPDRACAEWVLRNGGAIVWANGERLADYNVLPEESAGVPKILEIDATDCAISHYGFPHLSGCTELKKIVLHNSSYICNRAMKGMAYGKDTLTHVQVSQCKSITDEGVKELHILNKLETLVLYKLDGVDSIQNCKEYLKTYLPKCTFKEKLIPQNE